MASQKVALKMCGIFFLCMYKSQWSEYDMLKPKLAPCSPPEPGTFTSVNKINGKRYDKKSVVIVCHDGFLYIGRRLNAVLEVINAKLPTHRHLSHRHLFVMMAREAGGYHKGAWARRVQERELPRLCIPKLWSGRNLPLNVVAII